MTFAEILHGFFFFLGTTQGELLKTAIELIFFTFVDYMVISEWTRSRKKELKFLVLAFSALVISKLVSVYFLADYVFVRGIPHFHLIATSDNFFEIFALFLVANAFVYPIVRQKKVSGKRFMADHFMLLLGVSFVFSIFVLSILDMTGGSLNAFWSNTSVNVAKVVVLLYYAGFILVNQRYRLKYRTNIVIAFILYTIAPVIELFNIIIYDGLNPYLVVASHPFPFVSIMIFTQVIYLKLVDKATILDRLKRSERLYEQEKEVSKLKDEFISTVSHELKTPLTSMKLYVGLLKEKKLGPLKKKQVDALSVVNDETDRLNALITDLLDLSRLESGKSKLELSEFDLGSLVNNKLYLNIARRKKLAVNVGIPKDFIVVADKNKIKQVFINLFSNSVKFTPKRGSITVAARMFETEWEFSVSDNGKGIEKNKIPKLFDKFFQAEDFMTRKEGGTGLGLSIVKHIVDMHKGKIQVQSEIGKGTKVSICFPKLSRY